MSEAEVVGGGRVRFLARWAGTAMSLALVLGTGVWGWRLMEREVGGIPVIRAAEGPMRIAPEEPGGEAAEHQGLSVSRIAAREGEGELAAEVYLAPRVADLAAEDMPSAPAPEVPQIAATDRAVAEALGLDLAAVIKASAPAREAVARPLRTQPRLAPIAAGREAVQLGAFAGEDEAIAEWRSLVGRFPDLLGGTERRIERVEQESRTFWRLRAGGFTDLADARRVCAALKAGEAECVPVVRH